MPFWKGVEYDDYHGGPFDRGSADSYYGRLRSPHVFVGNALSGYRVTDLTDDEIKAYHAGYDYNESIRDYKQW